MKLRPVKPGSSRVGLLHPGQMGAAVGAAAATVTPVLWDPTGRSPATRRRAEDAGLVGAGSLARLCADSDIILSICPPHVALEVAESVAATGFTGVYVDANAIAPGTARKVADTVAAAGASFVDGGIVGGPPRKPGTTRLFLSGDQAPDIAELFAPTVVETVVLPGAPTAASALKATYAAWTKGSAALLLAVRETARAAGVETALLAEWARSQPGLADRVAAAERSGTEKGWRWVGEMEQIAATFAEHDQPAGFHEAAAEVYRRFPRLPE